MSNDISAKDVLVSTAPIIKVFVDTFLAPKLEKLKDRLSIDYKKNIVGIEKYLTEYFERSYVKYSILNTLVFNNSEKLLKDLYVPLTLRQASAKQNKYKIDGFPFAIADKYKNVLITDTAGMGKSTLVKRILLDIIDKSIGIPIIIELRRLSKDKTILTELREQLNSINKVFDEKLLLEILAEGDFIFFFDGFDEIPLADRDKVTNDIQQFTSKANSNRFFLTSRPEGSLTSFGDFHQFSIESLIKEEAYQLLRNYDHNGANSSLLIKKLKESDFRNIEEFLTNPLLVSLLFTAFEYKQVIPFKKHIFYRQVYDANFESHDLTKGDSYMHDKYSQLDIDDFHRVLRHIGFSCLKIQRIEFSKDELLNLIHQSKSFCTGLSFRESDFLKDLISTVPLFTIDGIYYRWSHKSLQEYFAAQFIYLDAKTMQTKILEKLAKASDFIRHYNLLDIYYDIDYKSYRDVFIYDLLRTFKAYADTVRRIKTNFNETDLISFIELSFPFVSNMLINLDQTKTDEFDKKFRLLVKKYNDEFEIVRRIAFDNDEHVIISLHFFDNKTLDTLLILQTKKNELVSFIDSNSELSMETLKKNKWLLKPNAQLKIELKNLRAVFKHNLKEINKILFDTSIFRLKINYNNAMSMLDTIETELNIQNNEDYLLSGL